MSIPKIGIWQSNAICLGFFKPRSSPSSLRRPGAGDAVRGGPGAPGAPTRAGCPSGGTGPASWSTGPWRRRAWPGCRPRRTLHWDGAGSGSRGCSRNCRRRPSNAYPFCPSRDLRTFRAPTDAELRSPANRGRLRGELAAAAGRCPGPLRVITLGRRAQWIFGNLEDAPGLPAARPAPPLRPRACSRPRPGKARA